MKQKFKIWLLALLLLMPNSVLAYSQYIIPGGETLGIDIKSDGIMIVGFYKINGKYNKNGLKVGDYIIKVNDTLVSSVEELTNLIESNIADQSVQITYKRNKKISTIALDLIYSEKKYKTGLYVKDNITGIGTLSYIDPYTYIYGALGHEIIESNSNSLVEIKNGSIFENKIISITKSSDGNPGSKNAKFFYNNTFGNVKKNTKYGIYGVYTSNLPNKKVLEVGEKTEVKIGKAYIYTVLKDETISQFEINITAINETNKIKNISFEITDKNLLEKTGGVVQGMSGSPIIQDDKIIGAVTHVVVDNVTTGYGIFITTMLEEGES